MSRTDQYLITLAREADQKPCGSWREFAGGGVKASSTGVRDQYGQPKRALGGPASVDTVTLTRTYYAESDAGLLEQLEADVGKQRYIVNRQKLSPDGFATGTPSMRKGVLLSATRADVNIDDDSPSADSYVIEIDCDGI